jgi:Cu(I)/Ag(I) efflux system membrane fusion protein
MKNQFLIYAFAMVLGIQSYAQAAKQQPSVPEYISNYIKLKDAAFASNMANIKLAANAMKKSIDNSGIADKKRIQSINSVLESIISATDITIQRNAFAKLSQYMINEVEANPITGIPVYSMYCPMANDGKGAYWLSLDKEVKNNPYMGSKMPNCGSIDQKISK